MISPIKPRRCAVLSDSRLTDRINRRQVFRGTDKPAESLTLRRLYSKCVIPVFEDGEIAEMGQFLYDNHNEIRRHSESERNGSSRRRSLCHTVSIMTSSNVYQHFQSPSVSSGEFCAKCHRRTSAMTIGHKKNDYIYPRFESHFPIRRPRTFHPSIFVTLQHLSPRASITNVRSYV